MSPRFAVKFLMVTLGLGALACAEVGAGDVKVFLTFHGTDRFDVVKCDTVEVIGPYEGEPGMTASEGYETVKYEKVIKGAEPGLYRVVGAVGARWKDNQREALAKASYELRVEFTDLDNPKLVKIGRFPASSTCAPDAIETFRVK